MNKPNYLKLLSLLITVLLIIPACNDDDDKIDITKDNIVGTWQYVWEEGYEKEGNEHDSWDEDLKDENWYLILNQNGTFSEEFRRSSGTRRYEGNWTLNNKILHLNFIDDDGNYTDKYTVIELTNKSLIMEDSYKNGNSEWYIKYTLHKK